MSTHLDRRRGHARGAGAMLVAVLTFVTAFGGLLDAPTSARSAPEPHDGAVASSVVAVVGAGHARVAQGARSVRTALAHRHGPAPVPGVAPSGVAVGGLLLVALLLAVATSSDSRRTAGASRVRAPPAVRV